MKIRVVHLITGLRRAGAETMLMKLVGALDRTRFETRIVTVIERGPLAPDLEAMGIPVVSLDMRSKLDPRPIARLIGILRRLRPDVIQTWLYHADFAGLIAASVLRRTDHLLWNVRCSDMDFAAAKENGTAPLVRVLGLLSARPSGVIVNSHAGRLHHERLGYRPRRWIEIPNGFELDRWHPDAAAAARLRAELLLPEDALVVGLCARLSPMKDHGNFLSAIRVLRERVPAAHAILVGRGTETLAAKVAEMGLSSHVTMLGERSDLPRLLPGLDVSCLSSAFGEGFANVLGEAMASGVPCVATDVGDAASIIGDTGRIVPPRRPEALAAALESLLVASAQCRHDLGRRARERIERCYGLDGIAQRYADLYADVGSGPPGA
ncbi:MAG TPA: glycosyltransferase [Stellaceae bacterium]|nr:glycosyltransferase [Stellaceae bacterium]